MVVLAELVGCFGEGFAVETRFALHISYYVDAGHSTAHILEFVSLHPIGAEIIA